MTFSARHDPIVPPHGDHAVEHRDAALLARARTGDPAAFETLFHAYYDPLCRLVDRYVRSAETAEEVVQKVAAYLTGARIDSISEGRLRMMT